MTELVLRSADADRLDVAAKAVHAMVAQAHTTAGLPAPDPY